MKSILSLFVMSSLVVSVASARWGQPSGAEALSLYHGMVFQMKNDMRNWLSSSHSDLAKLRKSSLHTLCVKGRDVKNCELAIKAALPMSVFVVRDARVFQLDQDLKTKYEFDVETGMRIFQLSTGLRWMARKDVYNGVRAPRNVSRQSYEAFLRDIEKFLNQKALEHRKAAPMIPPPPRR